ncbi:hypothetical protein IX27_04195 [Streptomyces sp. JS01]|uniref:hypothetical protein n=1 Tax=unclassified Streptomyces TaxID=2593676 RepID=UPI0005019FB1|nr:MULTISPECIES: hypothetical protein [unclassified Streptomyces]KFK90234.1 hypothetical protein IX27_04195 [Streptomyces sp. JS01]MBK3534057.1 hypothetical protein [Streptomyces sp. MBT72]MBK3540841.1 hypothetical protein [Streptomyces sp. MBT67]MBK3554366.1 hypothetical protein [Streptomyces sp. MBT61]MBK6033097.1 hypothetical protein [Streptomyces sp. MBT59]
MPAFYRELLDTDLSVLDSLADTWRDAHTATEKLPKRMMDEVLRPLRDKGYWEGAAAPHAWSLIDDIARQLTAANKVAKALSGVLDDAVADLKVVRRDLKDAVQRALDQGLAVDASGTVSGYITSEHHIPMGQRVYSARYAELAQEEIDEIVRRGITADQNLSMTLMADVGIGTWFNTKPQHSSIDTTDRIGVDEYNAYHRVLAGKDPCPEAKDDSPYGLGLDYVTGLGARHKDFTNGDRMAELMQSMESMKDIRKQTVDQWEETGEKEGKAAFSISESGKVGAAKKLLTEDLPAIVTNDPDHLGEAFMGSYNVDYVVRGKDPDGSLVVEYTLNNTTSSESALHFIGYYDWLKYAEIADGPVTSAVSQTVTWTERIPSGRDK